MMPLLEAPPEIAIKSPILGLSDLDFHLPAELEATEPVEARGLARDQVRLMVSHYQDEPFAHGCFHTFPETLEPGDALVINTSATLKAALPARYSDGGPLRIHLSTRLPGDLWIVELRHSIPSPEPGMNGDRTFFEAGAGEILQLPQGGQAKLVTPYDPSLRGENRRPVRLWLALLELPEPLEKYLDAYGSPIRYQYVPREWPIEYYQTVYAAEPGSAEMPSAGRAFTPEIVTRLVSKGVQVLPLILHTGVSSLEAGELPQEEYYRVPLATAEGVNQAKERGNKVIAVGTTSARALESTADQRGIAHPGEGWTRLVITPERGLRAIDGLLTGFHEAKSSHLAMLAALTGYDHLRLAYQTAIEERYLWHEFGDLHLILP